MIFHFDNFALDANLKGKLFGWDLEVLNSLNTLNTSRLSEALRSKTTLKKSFNLKKQKDKNEIINQIDTKNAFPILKNPMI